MSSCTLHVLLKRLCHKVTTQYCLYQSSTSLLNTSRFLHGVRSVLDAIDVMPKESKAVKELRRIRLKSKAVDRFGPPSNFYLQILGNGGKGNPRSLYVFTDRNRYLFNCSEGTQRLAHEHKRKLAKLEHVLFTYKSWENVGGLPGLSLTMQEIGVPEFTIHGPPGIEEIYTMMQSFLSREHLTVHKRRHSDGSFSDACMHVTYVPIYSDGPPPHRRNRAAENNGDTADKTEHQSPDPNPKRQKIAENIEHDIAIAYICKLLKKPGGLLIEKCLEKGVPPGPLLGQLKNGKDVTLPDGTFVKSEDVVEPDDPGPVFIVVECPNVSFLESLLHAELFKAHQITANAEDDIASVVVHFTAPEVMAEAKYVEWMQRFPASTFHLSINSCSPPIGSIATNKIQHQLHLVHPRIFPLLKSPEESNAISDAKLEDISIPTNTLMMFHLRPKTGLSDKFSVCLTPEAFVQDAYNVKGFRESLTSLQEHLTNLEEKEQNECPELVFLGTGSMIPNKVRNVSAILVNISNEASMLLDCGEGTYSQILHLYGSQTNSMLLKLKFIFISHAHADHHLGLIELLKKRERAFIESKLNYEHLTLLAPSAVFAWLKGYDNAFEPVLHHFHFISNVTMTSTASSMGSGNAFKVPELMVDNIVTVPVLHCRNAYGIVVRFSFGFKLVYSGDTMPCDALIKEGDQCTVLIHEATMEDDLVDEAIRKTHSTTSQAIEVGQKMKAGFTILTHFSQRYSKIPLFNENFNNRVGFAFDNMRIRPCDLHIFPLLIPTLKCLFAEQYEEMREKTDKRLTKQKLLLNVNQGTMK